MLIHFIVISVAVIIGLWLFLFVEWIIEKFSNNPYPDVPRYYFDEGQD